jgi:LAS superfamily LD-carboxypeptidase LdcB
MSGAGPVSAARAVPVDAAPLAAAAPFDALALTGRTRAHVLQFAQPRFAARPAAARAFLALRAAALADGIDLLPIASFRPFEAQVRIWNRKFSGAAPLYDRDGRARDFAALAPEDRVRAILGWSGLPGASRRHWGTDIDVFDRAALPPGYKTRLLPDEAAPGGVFARLHAWLDRHIERYGFYRPYGSDRGGMYPEPWHLSHAASAQAALVAYRAQGIDLLAQVVGASDMQGRALVLSMLPEIFTKHVLNEDPPSAAALAAEPDAAFSGRPAPAPDPAAAGQPAAAAQPAAAQPAATQPAPAQPAADTALRSA